MKRRFALAAGAALAPLLLVVIPATPALAHGYVSSPASRQAMCAQGKVPDCGPIVWEPQSVEGPKGQRNCHAGLSQFAQLNDDSRPWPTTSVSGRVTFNWVITARHSTRDWEYYIGNTRVAYFNSGGAQPGATVSHQVDLSGFSGRQKLLAIWNIADTPMAFYSCVDLQIGGGTTPPTTTPPTTTPPTTTPPTTTKPPTTTPPSSGTWTPGTAYATGAVVTYNGASYTCRQAHTALSGWEPDVTPALWLRS
ncbi:chitin-binding protein [Actinokineospora alba]|uniref:Chitin-binding protein n=1 Tax=Actinokineospora alba TaxID=504798 RepID=A0A1H0W8E5_9PSEU|nr:lytic polysaccharide monooxygenase [Actinokineospora alba]TDP69987.1 putative carbohydrate-binding protein with CBM5 and CBM33 domain [Actinokineospora alba]SDJ50480.1 chitin-binding protein [Actinokineospora alba]SDP86741.1 chitin-binding protein [Actinokineospora alba]